MGAVEAGLRRARTAGLLAAQRTAVRGMALAGDPVARMATMPADGDVYGQYERIRERGPIARSRLGALALTSRDLCDEVLRNPAFGVRARAATSESEGPGDRGAGAPGGRPPRAKARPGWGWARSKGPSSGSIRPTTPGCAGSPPRPSGRGRCA